jgi:signal transduction histidine kinase/ligand-binding sensor domain-containing protein/DNA-binding response OmpR family regulator
MKNRFNFWIAVAMLSLTVLHRLFAQPITYQFRHIDVNDGLSHNQVSCIFKDSKGFIWIGTNSGLNKFDGYTIRTYLTDTEDSTSISSNTISGLCELPDGKLLITTGFVLNIYDPQTEKFSANVSGVYENYNLPPGQLYSVVKDSNKNFWFIYTTGVIVRYDTKQHTSLILQNSKGNKATISATPVTAFVDSKDGGYWVIHSDGILERIELEKQSYKVTHRDRYLFNFNKGITTNSFKMVADSDGDLWLCNYSQGVFFFNTKTKQFQHFDQHSNLATLSSNLVSDLVQADNGLLWICTDHGGVNILDKKTLKVQYVYNKQEDETSLGQNSVNTIYRDDEGILWLGTFKKGVSYYHENLIRFPLYKHFPLSATGLPYSDVNRFVEDVKGNLWIGTNGGGLIFFDRSKNVFKQFLHDPKDRNSISSNVIVSLCIDHEQKLWIGSYYGGLSVYDGKKFTTYPFDPKNPEGISDENVWEIFEDSRKRLWVGTMHGGLNLLDRKTNTFSHYRQNEVNSVSSDYVDAITEDKDGNIWVGTARGVDVLERESGRFFHYGSDKNVKGSISDNLVFDIKEDSHGRIWIATGNGLNLFQKSTKTFTEFKEKQGLPHNTVLAILEDQSGAIWVSTSNGLSHIKTTERKDGLHFEFRNYDETDGLQGKQFNENAAYKTSKGELIFGGADGFNIFYPERLGENKNPPKVILSDFQIYNRSVRPGEEINGDVILTKSISETSHITLSPGQNIFSIGFAALNFFNPEKNQYQYMLKGSHNEWLEADAKSRRVTFTNLAPGEYTFIVKASNNDGYWNEKGVSLGITILPPFWKTRIAFVMYFGLIISALLITRKLIQKRERMKFEREHERNEAIRMHDLDMMKIKFFTNVSHEFRTPLTLILTPLDRMLRQAKEPEQLQQYTLIQRNAKRLLNLVNQLLDFRKLEVQEMKLTPSEGDVIKFIEETVFSFSDLSGKKDIKLSFQPSIQSLETVFDQDKLEKILFNLLSNAFKFTPEHGSVSVTAKVWGEGEIKTLEIKVSDTGIGIPPDKLEKIFDRFFQNELPKSFVNQGSGIGLSITKEFVKIHGGTISVESEEGIGTCFTVNIPVPEVLTYVSAHQGTSDAESNPEAQEHIYSKKPVLLLVEDNEDFRFYLKDNLKADYRIVEAKNGNEGWTMALETLPDLIVSDIMMAEMNGIELCRKIKADVRVSHTPVILLTARYAEEQKVEGFDAGADDYITKPFNFEVLVSRIRNLISKREKFHKNFPAQLDVKASELKITSMDEKFIQKAIKIVEDHISEPEFSVEDLSHELGISRAHFYKKIMSLTGKSPLEFIRMIRLQHAAQLLKKSQLTVAEIAYKVGFNNPKYFARYFKEEYKVLPSMYASATKKEE